MKPAPPALALAALALAAVALGPACHKAKPEEAETTAAVPVQVALARLGTITSYIRVTGTVDPAPGADWTITAPQQARVAEIRYAAGDLVRRGSVMARFDAPPLRADLATRAGELAQAHSKLDNARRNYDRLAILLEKGIASRKEVEDARKDLLDGEAAVRQSGQTHTAASQLAARATAVAPFDGVVAQRWHNPGDIIDANEHVLRLVDPRRLQVTAAVPVADATRITVGHAARVSVPGALATSSMAARVVGAPAAADVATGTAGVRVALSGAMPVGTPVQVEIEAEQRSGAVIVPVEAVVRDEQKTGVFVVGPDKKAHRREVVVGITSADDVQIVSGVRAGEQVIVKGQEELPDGAAVTIEEAEKEGGEATGKEEGGKTEGEGSPAPSGTPGAGAAVPASEEPAPSPAGPLGARGRSGSPLGPPVGSAPASPAPVARPPAAPSAAPASPAATGRPPAGTTPSLGPRTTPASPGPPGTE